MDLQIHPVLRRDLARRLAESHMVIVPIKPTREMLLAGSRALLAALQDENDQSGDYALICWRAMVNSLIVT